MEIDHVGRATGFKFALEDTTDKCYRDITNSLAKCGWTKVSYKKRSKMERKRYICIYGLAHGSLIL